MARGTRELRPACFFKRRAIARRPWNVRPNHNHLLFRRATFRNGHDCVCIHNGSSLLLVDGRKERIRSMCQDVAFRRKQRSELLMMSSEKQNAHRRGLAFANIHPRDAMSTFKNNGTNFSAKQVAMMQSSFNEEQPVKCRVRFYPAPKNWTACHQERNLGLRPLCAPVRDTLWFARGRNATISTQLQLPCCMLICFSDDLL